jgi:Rieske Fe-S protein
MHVVLIIKKVHRRKFITDSCFACAAMAGGGMLLTLLESCNGLPRISASKTKSDFSFPLSAFADKQMLIIQRNDTEFDAVVIKKADNTFITLELKCSHQDQPLTATAGGLHCTSHGSKFSLEGEVLNAPATEPLRKFPTECVNDNVIVKFGAK